MANAKLDKFLRKIVSLNIVLFWHCKNNIMRAIDVMRHDNWHSMISNYKNIRLFIKYMMENFVFKKQPGYSESKNLIIMIKLPNLFSNSSFHIDAGFKVTSYI